MSCRYHCAVRVVIVTDEPFVCRERTLIRRLLVGLADEGVRAQVAVPEEVAHAVELDVVGPVVPFECRGTWLSRQLRAQRLADSILASAPDVPVDIVHVMGGSAWGLASDVARRLRSIVVFEVWRAGLSDRSRAMRVAGDHRVAFFTSSPGIERTLLREGAGLVVRLTPWGVHAPSRPNPVLRPGRPPAIVLAGSGRNTSSFLAAFRGACLTLDEFPDAMLFVDADAARRAGIWKLAQAAGLLDRVSLIDAVEERRDLVVRNDILLYPDHRGEQRTLLLDAMAAGMCVIAHADPLVTCLIPDQTARVLNDPSEEIWSAELRRALKLPNEARALGLSARERIRTDYRATNHVRSVLDGYEWLTTSDAVAFRETAR